MSDDYVAALDREIDARGGADRVVDERKQFRLMSAADFWQLPTPRFLVHPIIPASGVGSFFGASTSGKTFVALACVAALCEGGHWFGYPVKGGQRCVYVCLEGHAGLQRRVQAWERSNEAAFPEGVRFLFDAFHLLDEDDVLALAAAIDAAGGADVIVIDTLNRAAPGADENSAVDAGRILEAAKRLQSLVGGLILLVHHTGKDASKGMRGHSSLFAAMDVALEVVRMDGQRELRVSKVKDGEDGAVHPFRLEVVDLGLDDEGRAINSCVVSTDDEKHEERLPRAKLPKGGNQKIVLDALRPLFRASHAFGRAGAPPVRPCLTIDEAVDGTAPHLVVEPKRRRERAQQAVTGLVASGVLGSNEGWLWLV